MESEELEVLIFSIGRQKFGADASNVVEVVGGSFIVHSEKEFGIAKKIVSFERKEIPLFNLSGQLGLNFNSEEANRFGIVIRLESGLAGFEVDIAREFITLTVDKIEAVPEYLKKRMAVDYIWGVGKIGEELIFLMDFEGAVQSDK